MSFYTSDELAEWIADEMERTGRSKTQVIVAALEEQRKKSGARRRRPQRR